MDCVTDRTSGDTPWHTTPTFFANRRESHAMRAVFFDLDGTLVDLPEDFAGLFEAALADHGVDAGPHHLERYTDAFFGHLEECHPEPYRMAMADLRAAHDLDPCAEALAETYTEREAAETALKSGAREALDALAAGESDRGDSTPDTALGVLTNGGERSQRRKLAHHDLADYFDAVVISGEVGAGKPDPDVFAAARDAVPADEYAFVADDLERDVLPAQEAGFTGVYLAGDDADADPGEVGGRPDERVRSLAEVPDALG